MIFLLIIVNGENGLSVESYIDLQTDTFVKMNAWLSRWPWFWLNITELGDATIFLALISFFILWKPQTWVAIFCAIPLSSVFSVVGKHWFSVPRPAAVLPHDQFNIVGKTLSAHNSLPSGHAITVVAIVTVVTCALLTNNRGTTNAKVLFTGVCIAGIAAFSRVAIGAHWPLDILVGSCLGFIGGVSGILLSQRYSSTWRYLQSRKAKILLGNMMFFWGIAIMRDAWESMEYALIVPWVASGCAISVATKLVFVPDKVSAVTLARKRDGKNVESNNG